MNLRDLQTRVITRMLRLNAPEPSNSGSEAAASSSSSGAAFDPLTCGGWKVLIYDAYCSDILSPLLSVSELRSLGITLHINIKQRRDAVRDTPAVYFVQPTQRNVELILADLQRGLYSSFHLHFSTSIPRPLLETLAARSAEQGSSGRIGRVYDEYAHFVCLEERLVTLNHPQSFVTINDPQQTDEAMQRYIDDTVDSLLSVVVTMGVVPVIRTTPDGAAALVGSRLDERLRSHLIQRQNLFSSGGLSSSASSLHRPLLVLVDRSIDLTAPLQHTWTYQGHSEHDLLSRTQRQHFRLTRTLRCAALLSLEALLNDLLGLAANRIAIAEDGSLSGGSSSPAGRVRTYELNSATDKFWKANAGKTFPSVAAAVQERMSALQEEQARISRSAGTASFESPGTATSELSSAISALPRLQKRKRQVETHTNIATALLKAIKARDIDAFCETEQQWTSRTTVDRTELDRLIASGKGTLTDRVRAAMVWCLSTGASDADVALVRQLLEQHSAPPAVEHKDGRSATAAPSPLLPELRALDYLQHYRFLHHLQSGHSAQSAAASSSSSSKAADDSGEGWGLFGKLATSVAKEVVSQTAGVRAGLRQLLPSNSDLPLTKLLDALVYGKDTADSERCGYLDPRLPKGKASRSRALSGYKDAVVFVMGGGCYNEYANLQDWAARSGSGGGGSSSGGPAVSVVYGCTELASPEQFLAQLGSLGEQHSQAKQQQSQQRTVPVD